MASCRDNYLDLHISRFVVYSLTAAGYFASLFALQLYHPVAYVLLPVEDGWLENATFVGFMLTACFAGRLAAQPGLGRQRVMLAAICAVSAFIALEEISWGQRIFGLATPEPLLAINRQGQITLHNTKWIDEWLWEKWFARSMLAWVAISAAALLVRWRFRRDPMAIGAPFLPARLWAFCFVAAFLYLFRPVTQAAEFAEFAIALLALFWAADLYRHFAARTARRVEQAPGKPMVVAAIAAIFTTALTLAFPGDPTWSLNHSAAHYFPEEGLMSQARDIFDYILANPEYKTDQTLADFHRLFPDEAN